jgi:hypothetical protein
MGQAASQGVSNAMGQAHSMGRAASRGTSKAMGQASSMGKAASQGTSKAMGQARSMGQAASRGASQTMGQTSSMGQAATSTGAAAGAAALPSGKAVIYKSDLTGDHESPNVDTDATGNVIAVLRGNHLEVSGNFADLSSPLHKIEGTSAHIHMIKSKGQKNGPVALKLNVHPNHYQRSGAFNGSFTLNSQQMQALKDGHLYVNVHTQKHPKGELRGKLKKKGGGFFGF